MDNIESMLFKNCEKFRIVDFNKRLLLTWAEGREIDGQIIENETIRRENKTPYLFFEIT